jgi:hypothetical protein
VYLPFLESVSLLHKVFILLLHDTLIFKIQEWDERKKDKEKVKKEWTNQLEFL